MGRIPLVATWQMLRTEARAMGYLFLLAIALTIVFRSTTAAERRRYLISVLARLDKLLIRANGWWRDIEPFRTTLSARTSVAPVTPIVAALNLVVVAGMFFHPYLLNDPNPLV